MGQSKIAYQKATERRMQEAERLMNEEPTNQTKKMKESDNIKFWLSVERTDPSHTKGVRSGGREITAINAQQQIKNATSRWGMYGNTWGLKSIDVSYLNELCNNQILAVSRAVFYYPNGEFEMGSSILVQSWVSSKSYNKVDDDFLKKLETDMVTKSLSKLGFNADVFMGMYDDNKYVAKIKNDIAEEKKAPNCGVNQIVKIKELIATTTIEAPQKKLIEDKLKLKVPFSAIDADKCIAYLTKNQ